MNNTLIRLTQPDNGGNSQSNRPDKTNSSVSSQQQSSTETADLHLIDTVKHVTQDTGNYPSTTPLMLVAAVSVFKSSVKKYSSLDYTKLKGICDVQGFSNPYAENDDEPVLQLTEGGHISIKCQACHTIFSDISEWLLAFKLYMDAVLIIYENREQKLNNYRDHINELCLKQNFYTVMSYNKDYRITLVTNQDTTLSDYNTEVEGRNFDITTIKRQRYNTY
ncbi:15906_t:CDS:2 [Cetraspora pellucida]|uniref:15906_t:CDS:1 n=1 Tax=Cetraspora pellucida TaxID=1433469 RepID=A0A9N9CQY0_9GLOM|nr:15906_t:CDS:2 [Cetraspora pellucida]